MYEYIHSYCTEHTHISTYTVRESENVQRKIINSNILVYVLAYFILFDDDIWWVLDFGFLHKFYAHTKYAFLKK